MAWNRLLFAVLFSLLSVVMWKSVACADLLVAPRSGVLDHMRSPKFKELCDNPYIDCSDLAENLYRASGRKGQVLEIKGTKGADLITPEAAENVAYKFHQVYVLDDFVFDPRLSPDPIPLQQFLDRLRKLNPDGIDVKVEWP